MSSRKEFKTLYHGSASFTLLHKTLQPLYTDFERPKESHDLREVALQGFLSGFDAGLKTAPFLDKYFPKAQCPEAGQAASGGYGASTEYVDLTDFRKAHILNNHKYGAGKSGKTEFPQSWSDEKILHYVSDIATDPNSKRGVGRWNSPYAIGVREGIEIRVDFYPESHREYGGMISTAYPLNTLSNPPKGGGY